MEWITRAADKAGVVGTVVSAAACPASLQLHQTRGHARRRLPVLLWMRELQGAAAPKARRLLRVLLIRFGEVPADPGTEAMLLRGRRGRPPRSGDLAYL